MEFFPGTVTYKVWVFYIYELFLFMYRFNPTNCSKWFSKSWVSICVRDILIGGKCQGSWKCAAVHSDHQRKWLPWLPDDGIVAGSPETDSGSWIHSDWSENHSDSEKYLADMWTFYNCVKKTPSTSNRKGFTGFNLRIILPLKIYVVFIYPNANTVPNQTESL